MILALLGTRVGLLAAAALAVFVFYEGVPVVKWIPGVGIIAEGRVDRAARAAREGYVLETRAIAAEAKNAELARQLEAGRLANLQYDALLKVTLRDEAAANTALEQRTADYEAKLAEAGRFCGLDQSDVDWLQ